MPAPGGGKMGDHLAVVARAKGKARPTGPKLPPEAAHIWGVYQDLDIARSSSGFGPNAIPYVEILAYGALIGVVWRPWQIRALRALDAAFLSFCAERAPK